jgi:hypothetical protein
MIAVLDTPLIRRLRRWLLTGFAAAFGVGLVGALFIYGLYFKAETTSRDTLAKAGDNWLSPLNTKWDRLSAGRSYSIQQVSEPAFHGEDSLRFEIRGNEVWNNWIGRSFRSEIDTGDTPPINSVRWYRFALLLPRDFPIEDNRLILFQWHGADKKYLGEAARSPVLAFRYQGGIFSLTMRHSAERIVHDPDAVRSENLLKTPDFPLGVWNDFVIQARWSFTSDGYVNVWWNGKQVVRYRGPVGYNDVVGPYVQFGLYRDESPKTYVAYISQVRGGLSPDEVGFTEPDN